MPAQVGDAAEREATAKVLEAIGNDLMLRPQLKAFREAATLNEETVPQKSGQDSWTRESSCDAVRRLIGEESSSPVISETRRALFVSGDEKLDSVVAGVNSFDAAINCGLGTKEAAAKTIDKIAYPELMDVCPSSEPGNSQYSKQEALRVLTAREYTKALGSKDSRVQEKAAYKLGLMNEGASLAVPTLKNLLKSNDGGVRRAAAVALDRIGMGGCVSKDYFEKLMERLEDKDVSVRREAVDEISKFRRNASLRAFDIIVSMERTDPDPYCREVAGRIIQRHYHSCPNVS